MSWSIQKMHPNTTCIFLKRFFFIISLSCLTTSALNLTLPHQYPDPEAVVQDVKWRVNASLSRRQTLSIEEKAQCLTGNPIDDCWRCDPNWAANRQKLADCVIGFARGTLGGKGGQIYVVTDSSDWDPANPTPGTLRHAVLQTEPLWIVFSGNMLIKLKHELIINSYKTIDGRGANIHITGNGCLTLQYVSHVIIHNIHIHHCKPSGNSMIASSPTHVGFRGKSDGDGISISGSQKIWIDHCALSYCTDGLVDAILGSTGITMSNSYFSHHNEVMLSGHNDKYPLGHRHAGPVGSVVALRTEKAAWCVLVRQLPTTTQAPFPVLRATTLPTTTQVAFSMFKQNITPNPFSKNTRITTKRTSTVVRWVTSEDLLDISIQNGCNYFL